MTPPSRKSAAGSSAMAASKVAISAGGASASPSMSSRTEPFGRQGGANPRHREQRRAQSGELARPHLAQRDARADPLDVREMTQRLAQCAVRAAEQRGDRVVAVDRDAAVAQRLRQPLAQCAAAHAGDAEIDRRQQRRRVAAAQGARQLEVAVRDRRQVDQLARSLHLQAMDVGERAALRVLGVGEQRAGGRVRCRQLVGAEGGERGDAQLLAEHAMAERAVELPGGAARDRRRTVDVAVAGRWQVAVDDHLGGREPRQPAGKIGLGALGQADLAVRQRRPRQAEAIGDAADGNEDRIALLGEQVALGQRPRRDDADDLALDRSLGRADLADLLADRDRLAEPDQLGEVGVDRVHRHAGHRDRLARARAARGQGDVEQAMRALRVIEEELVEVAHPVEEERVGMLGLDAQVLLHHRRVADRLGGVHRRSRARIADRPYAAVSSAAPRATLVCGASICTSWP